MAGKAAPRPARRRRRSRGAGPAAFDGIPGYGSGPGGEPPDGIAAVSLAAGPPRPAHMPGMDQKREGEGARFPSRWAAEKRGLPAAGPLGRTPRPASEYAGHRDDAVERLAAIADPESDDAKAKRYAKAMKAGWSGDNADDPITVVVWDDGTSTVEDGSHRVYAARRAGVATLRVRVRKAAGPVPLSWARTIARRDAAR